MSVPAFAFPFVSSVCPYPAILELLLAIMIEQVLKLDQRSVPQHQDEPVV